MVPHKHADFLFSLAKGEPITDFEIKSVDGNDDEWLGRNNAGHITGLILNPDKWEVRRKIRTYTIGKYDVPYPMEDIPDPGTYYYVVDPSSPHYCSEQEWGDTNSECLWLSRGLCHLTSEAAITHSKALISLMELE